MFDHLLALQGSIVLVDLKYGSVTGILQYNNLYKWFAVDLHGNDASGPSSHCHIRFRLSDISHVDLAEGVKQIVLN
jgi:hypothetical protein